MEEDYIRAGPIPLAQHHESQKGKIVSVNYQIVFALIDSHDASSFALS